MNSYQEVLGPYEELLHISRAYPKSTLAIGLHTQKDGAHYNSVILLSGGEVRGVYHKKHLIPFGEYTPRQFEPFVPAFEKLTAGDDSQDELALGEIPLLMNVCSEAGVMMNEKIPGIILSPSNDSVFSSKQVGVIHHLFSRMRALEHNAYLLRSSKGGISSIIAPDGKVLTQSVDSDEILFAEIEPKCPIQ
jgi:apolipoprotein N-acyltransferase